MGSGLQTRLHSLALFPGSVLEAERGTWIIVQLQEFLLVRSDKHLCGSETLRAQGFAGDNVNCLGPVHVIICGAKGKL